MKMNFRLPGLLLLILCSLSLNGCVTTSGAIGASAIKAPYANLNAYKTYSWYQTVTPAAPAYDAGYTENLNKHIQQAVEEELQQRGYRRVEEDADVLVAYDLSVSVPEEKDNPKNFREGFGYSYGYMSGYRYNYGHANMPGYRSVDLFKAGTLIIDLVNPKSNMLLWRGWAEGSITNFKAGYKKVQSQVQEVLRKL
jgi:hypothetical protein